jgi:hypothetical protein
MFDAGRRLKYERRDLNGGFASPVIGRHAIDKVGGGRARYMLEPGSEVKP